MLERIAGALFRAFLVGMLVIAPALALRAYCNFPPELVLFVGIIAGALTFIEYNSHYPSIVEFRDAPPINRLRFAAVFLSIFCLTLLARQDLAPTNLSVLVSHFATMIGKLLDFPFSPVRLIVLMLPQDADIGLYNAVRAASGMAYFVCMAVMLGFLITVRSLRWPNLHHSAFNVWTNLPLFDPTTGGDVVARLVRDARVNIIAGILLPFLIPAVVKLFSDVLDPYLLANPLTLIWTMTAWAFLPASMIMRGIAMARIADMIATQRRRTTAQPAQDAAQTA